MNDFRKLCDFEAYTPTDNVSELTARTNDEGWDTSFVNWLKGSRLSESDLVLVFSVGGGDLERNISPNLVRALQYTKEAGAPICGIVGRDGGVTAQLADFHLQVRPGTGFSKFWLAGYTWTKSRTLPASARPGGFFTTRSGRRVSLCSGTTV